MKKVSILDVCKLNDQTVKEFIGTKEYVATGGVEKDKIVSSTKVSFEEKPSRANREVEIGDILLAKMKETDKVLLINEENKDYIYSTGFFTIKPDTTVVSTEYIYYVLKSEYFQEEKNKLAKGATQKALNNAGLKKIKIPVPSKTEQEKIVNSLKHVESALSKRQQQIEALSALKQSVFLDMFGDPQLNSKEWPIGKISDLTEKTQYGTSKKAHETEGTYPVLRMNNLTYSGEIDLSDLKYVDLNEKEEEKYLVYPGEMLFNRTNSRELVGKTAVYQREKPIAYAGYLVKLIPNTKGNTTFISGYLNSHYGKRYLFNLAKNSIGMSNINATELRNIPIYIPPISLQNSYEEKINFIDEKVKLLKEGLRSLEMLYQSLLHKAFNGELFKEDINV